MRKRLCILAMGALILFAPCSAFSEAKLAWDASTGTVLGYRIYYGTSQDVLPENQNVGNVTQYPLSSLPLEEKLTYYFCVRAYNDAGESGDSNKVSWTVPDATAPIPPQGVTVQ